MDECLELEGDSGSTLFPPRREAAARADVAPDRDQGLEVAEFEALREGEGAPVADLVRAETQPLQARRVAPSDEAARGFGAFRAQAAATQVQVVEVAVQVGVE